MRHATWEPISPRGRFQLSDGRAELSVRVGSSDQVIYFAAQNCSLRPCDEALVSATLAPCMVTGSDYPEVLLLDEQFAAALPLVQDFYRMWIPETRNVAIPVMSTAVETKPGPAAKVGVFFSGGVDSFYTLLTHLDEITHICFVHGADIPLENTEFRAEVAEHVRAVGKALGKEVIEVETNIRSFLDQYTSWKTVGYGALLRTTALLLEGFSKFYISSSHYGGCLCPDGTHPVLDPLWSTQRMEFVHDGCQATRFRKCEFISRHPISYEHLRVCWQNRPGKYNCCQCEKCVRTMIYLQALDRLEHFPVFPLPLDPSKDYTSRIGPLILRDLYEPVYNYLQTSGKHPELMAYLKPIIFPSLRARTYQQYRNLRKGIKHHILRSLGNRIYCGGPA